MRDLKELNINDGGKPVIRLAPSEQDFALYENFFGVFLPNSFKRFLMFSNGGHPELSVVGGQGGQYSVDSFYYLLDKDRGSDNLWDATETWRPVLGPMAVPFADDGLGNQFFLDLLSEPPCVKICIHDEDMATVTLAGNFEDFIASLDIDPDHI